MWTTAKVIEIEKHPSGFISVKVEFAQDNAPERTIHEFNVSSKEDMKAQSIRMIDSLNLSESIALGDIDLTPTQQTQQELDRTNFFKNYIKLGQLNKVVAEGIIESNDQSIIDLKALLAQQFRAEYF